MPDWDALEDAAGGVRRLTEALSAHHAPASELLAVGEWARAAAERIERAPERDKLSDFEAVPHVARIYRGEGQPLDVADGETVTFDPFSFVGGVMHPASIGLGLQMEGEEAVGRVVVAQSYSGPPERAHGGTVAALFDETMSVLNRVAGRRAFTASLTVNFRAPAPLGVELEFRSHLVNDDGRKITIAATGTGPDGLFADATGLFIRPRE